MLGPLKENSDQSDSEDIIDEQTNNLIGIFKVRKLIDSDKQPTDPQIVKIKDYLKCPICLSLFKQPVYIKDCSHRYCKECIEKNIRLQKEKSCPTCRKRIATRRDLRVDEIVTKILNTVIPDIEQYLIQEDLQIQQEIKNLSQQKQKNEEIQKLVSQKDTELSCNIQLYAQNQLIHQIDKNYIRAPLMTTVADIIQLIGLKLNLPGEFTQYIDIYINNEIQTQMDKTLAELNSEYWGRKEDYQIYNPNDFHKWSSQEMKVATRQIHYSIDRFYQGYL
ncbi:unnamed protein product [Paramecium pentaurelia]|uniref:RING-type E3 ubiquitin transferase n=1 Tax=Paramecium pentaurelia TaxID=43138 RepID=A0A8S1WTW5_9CILI|nr:unnamed protein product [Paramecium pentaurelia]